MNRKTRRRRGGVTFKNEREVREYEIPEFSNLFNSNNEREINEGVVSYYNGRLPFNSLISSKGQTNSRETKRVREARNYYAARGYQPQVINAMIRNHKGRINNLTRLRTHVANVREAHNDIINYSTMNVPIAVMEHENRLQPETLREIGKYGSANINHVKGIMQKGYNDEISAAAFGEIYNMLPINNNDTNATIRGKLMNLIRNMPPGSDRNYYVRRIHQYHGYE
jgi:hypothetical protein